MSIFGKIKDAIFGSDAHAAPAAPAPAPMQAPQTTIAPTPVAAAPASADEVDHRLSAIAAKKGQPSNYKSSIVDLMKLLDLDSSLSNRTELANELGYTGDTNDSATMNIWLHEKVMERLAKRGQ